MQDQTRSSEVNPSSVIGLRAKYARELMTTNPISIRETASPVEAASFLCEHHISAAPVIDVAGKPVGVLSLTDLVWYQRSKGGQFQSPHEFFQAIQTALSLRQTEPRATLRVRDIMTPAVFAVRPETPVKDVIEEMFHSEVHRLFVVDEAGTLVGIVTAFDIVRHLAGH